MGVEWTTELATGVAEIDEQHRELFRSVGRFLDRADQAGVEELLDLLQYLGGYVDVHFRTEEAFMKAAAYPGMNLHLAEHDDFRAIFSQLVSRFARHGDDPRVSDAVREEVVGWLDRHVRSTDRALGEFLRERGITSLSKGA